MAKLAVRWARGLALVTCVAFSACGEAEPQQALSCDWPAKLDPANAGPRECVAALNLLTCKHGDGSFTTCLSNNETCQGEAGPCEDACKPDEYAVSCGGIGPVPVTEVPANCGPSLPTPGGLQFACCPCEG